MTRQHFIFSALILATSTLAACAGVGESESDESENVNEARQGQGGTGTNDLRPQAVDEGALQNSILSSYSIITLPSQNVLQICDTTKTIDGSGCTMAPEWQDWLEDTDTTNRSSMMKAMVKCATEPGFTVATSDNLYSYTGQWPLYTSWKDHRLDTNDKRERVSSCILSLLNGNGATLALCIVGPGGSPYSDACDDPTIKTREGGFFGNLFLATPKAYVVGPNTDTMLDTGRACTSDTGSYCCAESDNMCPHHIYKAGAFQGPSSRCRSTTTVTKNGNNYTYCNEFYSTREPNKSYFNGFTTFVPPAQ